MVDEHTVIVHQKAVPDPKFPERFGSIEHARAFSQTFFPWYNTEHYHSGLGLMTPEDVQLWKGQ